MRVGELETPQKGHFYHTVRPCCCVGGDQLVPGDWRVLLLLVAISWCLESNAYYAFCREIMVVRYRSRVLLAGWLAGRQGGRGFPLFLVFS